MKITTWNVNGVRARLAHVIDFLRNEQPDVLCLQETKVEDAQFPRTALEDEGYEIAYFGQKGYNGLAILAQDAITDLRRGLVDDPPDAERRALGGTVRGMRVLDLYVPNGQEVGSDKYRYKLDWLRRLRNHLDTRYHHDEPLVVVGDFNVTLDDRDVHDPTLWRDKILCSAPEREAMRTVMAFGLDDTLRRFRSEAGIYTWWHYRVGPTRTDEGLRIDYILTNASASARCTGIQVHLDERLRQSPSDHVPVTATFTDA
jgi:exodeoxyribonuclease III